MSVESHFEADFAGEPVDVVTQSQQDVLSTDALVPSQALVPHSFSMLRADTSTDLELVVVLFAFAVRGAVAFFSRCTAAGR